MLEEEDFEVLPIVRVGQALPIKTNAAKLSNPYVLNVLMGWGGEDKLPPPDMSLASCLAARKRLSSTANQPKPRIAIFDQFEELFTTYPHRWRSRTPFFEQLRDALVGNPIMLRTSDLHDTRSLLAKLGDTQNPLSVHLQKLFSDETLRLMESQHNPTEVPEALTHSLTRELNRVIQSAALHRGSAGTQVPLTLEMVKVVERESARTDPLRLNRMLLEAAFPGEFTPSVAGDPWLRVLFVMREDYIAWLDPYASILPEKLCTRFHLQRLRESTALIAVTQPLVRTPRRFAEGVAEALVKDLRQVTVRTPEGRAVEVEDEFVEPVQLQVVCQTLWQELPPDVVEISYDHLQKSGDVSEALAKFYERCIAKAVQKTGVKEGLLRRWFEFNLITPANTRATLFRGANDVGGIPNATVSLLEKLYIVRAELRGGQPWYELTHDRLIEPIQKANEIWRGQRIGAVLTQKRLESKAAKWVADGRTDDNLLLQLELPEAEGWLASQEAADLGVTEDLKALVVASHTAITNAETSRRLKQAEVLAEEQRCRAEDKIAAAKRMRILVVSLAIAATLAVVAALYAYSRENAAKDATAVASNAQAQEAKQRAKADKSRQEAENALTNTLLAKAAANVQREKAEKAEAAAENAAKEAIEAGKVAALQREKAEMAAEKARIAAVAAHEAQLNEGAQRTNFFSLLLAARAEKHLDIDPEISALLSVEAVRASPEQAESVGMLRRSFRELATRAILRSASALSCAMFSPNGQFIVTSSDWDGTLQVWETTSSTYLRDLKGHAGSVHRMAFSPDGTRLATEAMDGTGRIWQLASGQELAILRGLTGHVAAITFSPDGSLLATEAGTNLAKVWNAFTGKEIAILRGHTSDVSALAFSTSGNIIATASWDGTARLWDPKTGKPLKELKGHTKRVNSVAFSPDGKWVVTSSDDNTARMWDSTTGQPVRELKGHRGAVWQAVFSPDSKRILTAGDDSAARVWDTNGWTLALLVVSAGRISSAAFSPDSKSVVTAGLDGVARVWSADNGQMRKDLRGHKGAVNKAEFSPDGETVLTAGEDGTARIWSASDYSFAVPYIDKLQPVTFSREWNYLAVSRVTVPPPVVKPGTAQVWDAFNGSPAASPIELNNPVTRLALSLDGHVLSTLLTNNTTEIREVMTGRLVIQLTNDSSAAAIVLARSGDYQAVLFTNNSVCVQNLTNSQESVILTNAAPLTRLSFTPDGKFLFSIDTNNFAQVLKLGSPMPASSLNVGEFDIVSFSPIGKFLATAQREGLIVHVWDTISGREITTITNEAPVRVLKFSPDGNSLAIATRSKGAGLWSATDGRELLSLTNDVPLTVFEFSPDGTRLATSSYDERTVRVWDVVQGSQIAVMRVDSWATLFAFSTDGRYLASTSFDDAVTIWEAGTGRQVAHIQHEGLIASMAFTEDGKHFVTATKEVWKKSQEKSGSAQIQDAATGSPVGPILAHNAPVYALAFSPDGRSFATGCADNVARIWGITTGGPITAMTNEAPVRAITFSLDGKYLATATTNNVARVWLAAGGHEVASLTNEAIITAIALSPDGTRMATGGEDCAVRVWDLASRKEIAGMTNDAPVTGITFGPDGKCLATTTTNNIARVWSTIDWLEIAKMAHAQNSVVTSVAFSPDGTRLATGSDDRTVRVWEAANGTLLATIPYEGKVWAVAFNEHDPRYLRTASRDVARVELWNVVDLINEACARVTRNLTIDEWRQLIPGQEYHRTCPNRP
jgi:WD40 repeat protein